MVIFAVGLAVVVRVDHTLARGDSVRVIVLDLVRDGVPAPVAVALEELVRPSVPVPDAWSEWRARVQS